MLADRCVHQRVQAQPLPLQVLRDREAETRQRVPERYVPGIAHVAGVTPQDDRHPRSEEHTSELQSRSDLVCRLLLEKKKKQEPDQHECGQREREEERDKDSGTREHRREQHDDGDESVLRPSGRGAVYRVSEQTRVIHTSRTWLSRWCLYPSVLF